MMKKVITLILTLAMVLVAVSALAVSDTEYQRSVGQLTDINNGKATATDEQKATLVKRITEYEAAHPSITPSGLANSEVKDVEKEETAATTSAAATTSTATTATAATTAKQEEKKPFTSEVVEDSEQTKELLSAFQDALKAGDVLAVFPEDVKKSIPEGYNTINEVITILLSGDAEGISATTIGFKFQTQYKAGEKVILAFGITPTRWILKEGTVQEDGSVNVKLDKETIDLLLDRSVTLAVISQ